EFPLSGGSGEDEPDAVGTGVFQFAPNRSDERFELETRSMAEEMQLLGEIHPAHEGIGQELERLLPIEQLGNALRIRGEETGVTCAIAVAGTVEYMPRSPDDVCEAAWSLGDEARPAAWAVVEVDRSGVLTILGSADRGGPADLSLLDTDPVGQRLSKRD